MTKKNEEYTPDAGFNVDSFDLEADWKPEPLIPVGTYRGNVVEVSFKPEKSYVTFVVCLQDNGGTKSDGETPIDGSRVSYNVFLPRPEDRTAFNANGKNKWQTKVNLLKEFSQKMEIDMNTPEKIQEAIANAEWMGLSVQCTIETDTYQGKARDSIKFGTLVADRA